MASGAVGVNSANVQGRVAAAYANDTAPATTPSKKSLLEIQFVSKHICKTSLTLKTQKWRQILRGRPVRLCVLSNTSESRLIWFRFFFQNQLHLQNLFDQKCADETDFRDLQCELAAIKEAEKKHLKLAGFEGVSPKAWKAFHSQGLPSYESYKSKLT